MAADKKFGENSVNLKESENVATDSKIIPGTADEGTKSVVHYSPYRFYTPPIGPKDHKYKMNGIKRGKAIIFNHEKFAEARKLEERQGTVKDVTILKQCLEKFKFEVEIFNDLKIGDIHKQLQAVSQENHKDEDCILIAVLTHGKNDLGKDKLYAHDFDYEIETLWSYFTADMCPTLAGKPKIFIIQACRGVKASEQLHFKSGIQEDSAKVNVMNTSHRYSIPVEADILFAFSTFEGHVALRDTQEGSWFIQELCTELEENGDILDLLSMLTNVNRHVAINYYYNNGKQMPCIQSTLTRKVFLNSTAEDDQQNLAVDFNNILEETNKKFDQIIKLLEYRGLSSVTQKSKLKKKAVSNWNSLQTPLQPIEIALPDADKIFKHAELLRMFLEDDPLHLSSELKEKGTLILNFLSCWDHLNEDMKQYAYKNLVIFLNENARNWKMYKFLDIPESNVLTTEHCHRRWSQSDVVDAGSSHSRVRKYSSKTRKY